MIRWIIDLWHRRQRQIDIELLWPSCRDMADNLAHARAAFAVHAFNDRAWQALGDDGIRAVIDNLS